MNVKIKIEEADMIKLKELEGFNENNSIQTSYADWIQFILQPERLNPEDAKISVCDSLNSDNK